VPISAYRTDAKPSLDEEFSRTLVIDVGLDLGPEAAFSFRRFSRYIARFFCVRKTALFVELCVPSRPSPLKAS